MSRRIALALALALAAMTAGAVPAPAAAIDAMTLFDAAALGPDFGAAEPNPVRGRTIRWTWNEGPAKGTVSEYVFQEDGAVLWRVLKGPHKGFSSVETKYAAACVERDLYTVTYRAAAGYTMTVLLNFKKGTMVGLASGPEDWYPARGTFAIVK